MMKLFWGLVFLATGVFFVAQIALAAVVMWPLALLIAWWCKSEK
jgi:hypothetical protein